MRNADELCRFKRFNQSVIKALKHNKAYDMTNVLKRLFPDKYARWHKLSSIKGRAFGLR